MVKVNIAEASRRLEELIARAYAGETVVIEREGGGGVRLTSEFDQPGAEPRFDVEKHRRWLADLPMDPRSQEEIIAERKAFERS